MKVGDYVRTKDGIILRIEDIEDIYTTDNIYIGMAIYDNEGHFVNEVEIIKSSPNIIDLIKEGDYVNGKLVIEHAYQKGKLFVTNLYIGGKGFTTCEDYSWELTKEDEDRIETIVTKEQFENMKYKVVE